MSRYRFTSESVTEGHPDKVCDAISDAILDGILAQDPTARVACEALAKTGMVIVAGEITTTAWVDIPVVVRDTVRDIGYTHSTMGFDADTCAVLTAIEKQSPDISQGVTEGEGLHKEQGAGDQGLMFGYATDETANLMPAPIDYAHRLARRLSEVRKQNKAHFLRPDGKTQVTLEYDGDVPVRVDAIVVSSQHDESVKYKTLREAIIELVVERGDPEEAHRQEHEAAHQPDGSLRGRRAARRLRPHGAQDHRRHLRRDGSARRRRVLGQGPVEGRPLRLLLRALRREEHRRLGRRAALRAADRVRHRRRPARRSPRRHVRHGQGERRAAREVRPREVRPASEGHHPRAGLARSHLPPDSRVRPLRPQRVLLGEDDPRRPDSGRLLRGGAGGKAKRIEHHLGAEHNGFAGGVSRNGVAAKAGKAGKKKNKKKGADASVEA